MYMISKEKIKSLYSGDDDAYLFLGCICAIMRGEENRTRTSRSAVNKSHTAHVQSFDADKRYRPLRDQLLTRGCVYVNR